MGNVMFVNLSFCRNFGGGTLTLNGSVDLYYIACALNASNLKGPALFLKIFLHAPITSFSNFLKTVN